jgi:hypothetical protein
MITRRSPRGVAAGISTRYIHAPVFRNNTDQFGSSRLAIFVCFYLLVAHQGCCFEFNAVRVSLVGLLIGQMLQAARQRYSNGLPGSGNISSHVS